MEFNKDIKLKVSAIVEAYIRTFPTEYAAFRKQAGAYRDNLATKWAELPGTEVMVRELNRYPETLHSLIKAQLSEAEYLEFRETKTQQWFGNHFKDFKVAEGKI